MAVLFGAFISILVTALVEWLRKPRLSVMVEAPPFDASYPDEWPARRARYLRVNVTNWQPPWWFRWMSRNAALHCEAEVTFLRSDGQRLFAQPMPGRWADLPEPVPMVGEVGGQRLTLYDPNITKELRHIDIYPGQPRLLDVAARLDSDQECYGWTEANYSSEPPWKNHEWKLPAGLYLVKIKVNADAATTSAAFRLINDVSVAHFRLEPSLSSDPVC
jgi:hypothetical protein